MSEIHLRVCNRFLDNHRPDLDGPFHQISSYASSLAFNISNVVNGTKKIAPVIQSTGVQVCVSVSTHNRLNI